MSDTIDCPFCGRRLKLPVELLGQDVRCPTCDKTFTASLDGDPMPDAEEKSPPAPSGPPAEARRNRERIERLKHCPDCGAVVDRDARLCRRCSAPLDGADDDDRRDREPHRGGAILTLGILSALFGTLSLCCGVPAVAGLGFGIPAWVMATHDMHKMRRGVMDRNGMANTQSGQSYAMVGVVLSFLCGTGYTLWFVTMPMRMLFR
jgi:hypothetical protein